MECGIQELLQYTFSLQWQKDYAEKLVCNINEELDYVSDGEGNAVSPRKLDLYHSPVFFFQFFLPGMPVSL